MSTTSTDAAPGLPKEKMKELRHQLRFYFSDANLRRDDFMLGKVGPRGTDELPVSLLLKFNRVKAMTRDVAVVAAALRQEPTVWVSDDGERVARVQPLPARDNSRERTVYIENLPAGATREAVQDLCAPCGAVAYVSAPKFFEVAGGLGFAFIEFELTEGARRAVATLAGVPAGKVGSGGGASACAEALRVVHQETWEVMQAEYKRRLREAREGEAADAPSDGARSEAREAAFEHAMAAEAADVDRRNVVKISGLPKGAPVKAVRAQMRSEFGEIAPIEFVDFGVSNSGDTSVAYVRMATALGAAEAVRILSERRAAYAGQEVELSLVRGEALASYLSEIGALRRKTAAARKAKRDKWWHRKYGKAAEGGGEGGGEEASEPAAVGDKRAREDGAEGEPEAPKRPAPDAGGAGVPASN